MRHLHVGQDPLSCSLRVAVGSLERKMADFTRKAHGLDCSVLLLRKRRAAAARSKLYNRTGSEAGGGRGARGHLRWFKGCFKFVVALLGATTASKKQREGGQAEERDGVQWSFTAEK